MKQLKSIKLIVIAMLLTLVCTSCHWQLRSPNEVPPQLKVLYLDAGSVESHFLVKLKNLLESMHIQKVAHPTLAPFALRVSNYSLVRNNPSVSTTNVAITYIFTLQVTVAILGTDGHIIVPPRQIVATRNITVNVNQIFTINSTNLFQQELQREVINLMYYWLTSESTQRLLVSAQENQAHAAQSKTIKPTP